MKRGKEGSKEVGREGWKEGWMEESLDAPRNTLCAGYCGWESLGYYKGSLGWRPWGVSLGSVGAMVVRGWCGDPWGSPKGVCGESQWEGLRGAGGLVWASVVTIFCAGAPGTLWVGSLWPRSARLHWAPPQVPPDGYILVYGPPGGPLQVISPNTPKPPSPV